MKSLRIATLQGKWFKTTEATNAWYVSEAKKLKDSKLDILVLPELYHTPYFPIEEGEKGFDWAIEKNDALVSEWQTIAKELNAVVVFPFFEKRARGIYYNSAYVFERDGSIAGLYRKSHIPDDPGFYEKYYFAPGDTGFEPIQTSAGKIGVLICWDQWFPEAARINALKGADVLIYPTAIGWDCKEPKSLYERQKDSDARSCNCEPPFRRRSKPHRNRRRLNFLGTFLRERSGRIRYRRFEIGLPRCIHHGNRPFGN